MKYSFLLTVSFLLLLVSSTFAQQKRVLKLFWIGNSVTANGAGLQNTVREMINKFSSTDTIVVSDTSIKRGANLDAQYADSNVIKQIRTGNYTHVIVQPFDPNGGTGSATLTFGRRLIDTIKTYNKIPVVFIGQGDYTCWNCFPQEITIATKLADTTHSDLVPCFNAWLASIAQRPDFTFWNLADNCDMIHQNDYGIYLNTCMFYYYFTKQTPQGLPYILSAVMSNEDRMYIQRIAFETWRTIQNKDTLAPRIASAHGYAGEGIWVRLNENLDSLSAVNGANYSLSPNAAINSVIFREGGKQVFLNIPTLSQGKHTITIRNVRDKTPQQNAVGTETFTLVVPARLQWSSVDIGNPVVKGSTTIENIGKLRIVGAGVGVTSAHDQFRYVYNRYHGDFEMSARITSITGPIANGTLAMMVRESEDYQSRMVSAPITVGAQNTFITVRSKYDSAFVNTGYIPGLSLPAWLKMKRTGDSLTIWYTTDTTIWILAKKVYIPFKMDLLTGFASFSNCKDPDTALVDNIKIIGTPVAASAQNERRKTGQFANAYIRQTRNQIIFDSKFNASTTVSLYSVEGRLLLRVKGSENGCVIPTNRFAPGSYFVIIEQAQQKLVHRVFIGQPN